VPGDFGWDDVGSWTSMERLYEKDEYGNVIKGNVVSVDTKKCIIAGSDKLIATLGIEDVIIVDTEDALLICSKDKAQNVKEILKELRERKSEYL
jgi:Mannose-6-phosphate isomerase.